MPLKHPTSGIRDSTCDLALFLVLRGSERSLRLNFTTVRITESGFASQFYDLTVRQQKERGKQGSLSVLVLINQANILHQLRVRNTKLSLCTGRKTRQFGQGSRDCESKIERQDGCPE